MEDIEKKTEASAESAPVNSAQAPVKREFNNERSGNSNYKRNYNFNYNNRSRQGSENGNYNRNNNFKRRKRKVCEFCAERLDFIDYKDTNRLSKFLSDRSKIVPRRSAGTCARHQRELAIALKRARYMALLPYCNG